MNKVKKLNGRLGGASAKARKKKHKRLTIRFGRRLTEKEIQKAIEEGWAEAVKWNPLQAQTSTMNIYIR